MKGFKAFLTFLIVLFIGFAVVGTFLFSDKIVIEELFVTIDIDEAGNITVEEDILMEYRGDYNERWRDIKFTKNHYDNPLFYNVDRSLYKNDEATFISGIITSVEKNSDNIIDEVKIGYSYNDDRDKYNDPVVCDPYSTECESLYIDATRAGGLEGTIKISYRYEIAGMVTQYNDISELNYRIFEYMEAKVKKATVNVYLTPSTAGFSEEEFYCYGHGLTTGKITQSVTEKSYVNQPDFSYTARNIKTDEFFEIRVLMPNNLLTKVNQKNVVKTDMFDKIIKYETNLAQETLFRAKIGNFVNAVTIIFVILIICLIIYSYFKFDKEYKPEFDGEYYRDLPSNLTPAEMSYLYYFKKTNDEDVTATLLDLIRKKVLILDVNNQNINEKNPNYKVILNKEMYDSVELLSHEKYLISWFIDTIGNGKEVYFEEIENYGSDYYKAMNFQKCADNFKKCIKNECAGYDFFEEGFCKSKSLVIGLGFASIIIGAAMYALTSFFGVDAIINFVILIIFGLALILYVYTIKKRSHEGNEEFAKWKAFKKFLVEFSNFEDYPIPGIIVWEKYLVYATSLKIADKVMDQLEVKLPEYSDEGTTYMRRSYYGYHFHYRMQFRMINSSMRNARFQSMSTIAAHNARSGGGGHGGGFSGGSSFGGGGGGGRSR